MLDCWSDKTIGSLSPAEATQLLIRHLEQTCSDFVVHSIKEALLEVTGSPRRIRSSPLLSQSNLPNRLPEPLKNFNFTGYTDPIVDNSHRSGNKISISIAGNVGLIGTVGGENLRNRITNTGIMTLTIPLEMYSSPEETKQVSNKMKDDITKTRDDYQTGVTSLRRKDTNILDRRIIDKVDLDLDYS